MTASQFKKAYNCRQCEKCCGNCRHGSDVGDDGIYECLHPDAERGTYVGESDVCNGWEQHPTRRPNNENEFIVYHYTGDDSNGLPYVTDSKENAFDHARKWCVEHRPSDASPNTACIVVDANADEAIGCVANWSEKIGKPVAMSALVETMEKMNKDKDKEESDV